MFADVMVRVTGFAFVTSTPSAVSAPEDSKPSGGVCSCSPARQTAVTPCITGLPSVSVSGVLFTRILCSPFTGPSTGPSPMASITLIICVDLRLSFASRGVCALPPPLPTESPFIVRCRTLLMYKNNRHPGECLHHDGIKILNIFTFSQTDCGADNFAALVFFCRDIKKQLLNTNLHLSESPAAPRSLRDFFIFIPVR